MTESDYPHWKEALFGNSHVANTYCAIKYGFWHGAHLLLAAFLLLMWVTVKAWRGLKSVVGCITPDSTPSSPSVSLGVAPRVRGAVNSSYGKKAGRVAVALYLVGIVAYLGYMAITSPLVVAASFGAIALLAAVFLLWIHFDVTDRLANLLMATGEKTAAGGSVVVKKGSAVREKSQDKPIVRRVLGYCPVHMDIDPKWFDSFEDRIFDDIMDDRY